MCQGPYVLGMQVDVCLAILADKFVFASFNYMLN
jgi:hypothetical protein